MHRNKQWRRIHAGRDFVQRRQNTAPDSQDGESLDDSDPVGDILQGPITITITTAIPKETLASSTEWVTITSLSTNLGLPTVSPKPTSSSITAQATSQTSLSSTTAQATSQTSFSSTSTTSSTSSSETPPPDTSVLAPSATYTASVSYGTNDSDTKTPPQQNLSSSSSNSLSAGGIAGILIAVLAVVGFAILFFLRKRFINKRKRAAGAWSIRSGLIGPGLGSNSNFKASSEPKSYDFAPSPSPTLTRNDSFNLARDAGTIGKLTVRNFTPTDVTPPPTVFNTRSTPSTPSIVVSSDGDAASAGTSLMNSNISPVVSPFLATVMSTYIVSLPDELAIVVGEKMRILAEYDDGWALCMNTSGEQGMAPLECLDRGGKGGTTGLQVQQADVRASRRFSSLSPLTTGGMPASR